jgi:5-methyltetrahydropteroyltriglutamate--homocysteine methyltransferase
MPDRILTSHAGSLPRPGDLITVNSQRAEGTFSDEAQYQRKLSEAVGDVVRRQRDIGIDLLNDGEYGWRARPSSAASPADIAIA